jgi:monoamine oxidase
LTRGSVYRPVRAQRRHEAAHVCKNPRAPVPSYVSRENADVDVVVVGAGVAGLVAARRVAAAGRSVLVVEARERVGGRVETVESHGHAIDLGGSWIGAEHQRARRLAGDLGLRLTRSYDEGRAVELDGRGRGARLRRLPEQVNRRVVYRRLDQIARRVPVDAPWSSPRAAALDSRTLAAWLRRVTPPRAGARRAVGGTMTNVLAADPAEVSLLHALFYLHSNRGLEQLLGTEGGAQQDMVAGGAQSIADRIAQTLDGALALGAPVRRVEHSDGVRVECDGLRVDARAAVVSLPPLLGADIAWSPALPAARDELSRRMPHGDVVKVAAVYEEAFWRTGGLSGEAWGYDLPFDFTHDVSAEGGAPGVIATFYVGERALRLRDLTPDARRAASLAGLEHCFGPRAAHPLAVLERDWGAEQWSRGGYGGYMTPGGWTGPGRALRAPVGPISWAGSETASEFAGYIEGAVESGERAANEALARLG